MTQTQQPHDLRPVLARALDVTDSLVATAGPDDLDRPTPCSEFDVRELVDHLAMVVDRIRVVAEGRPFTEATSDAGWGAGLAALRAALPDVDLARTVTAPFGTAPVAVMLGMYVSELTVHGWDLARALGREDLLDPALAEPQVEHARAKIPAVRDGMPFEPPVEVADDAPAYDRLVGWYGRDPKWSA